MAGTAGVHHMTPSVEPSDADEGFATIVARLGHLGERRSRRVALGASITVGTLSVLLLAFAFRWPWQALVSFVITFVIALGASLAVMTRGIHRRWK